MTTPPLSAPPPPQKTRGQSLIEVTLFMPILLMMIAGLVEFGFALNQYLNTLDAAREASRYSSDGDPTIRAACGNNSDDDLSDQDGFIDDGCPGFSQIGAHADNAITNSFPITDERWLYEGTADFYVQAASIALQTVSPVPLDPFHDDVVISVFRVLSGTIVGRWPNCQPQSPRDCPNDPPTFPETLGEWHLYGYSAGPNCNDGVDNNGNGLVDEGCYSGLGSPNQLPNITDDLEGVCDPDADPLCHPSELNSTLVQGLLDPAAPNSAVVAVEIFFSYNQILALPWITPFVPDPIKMHTFTVSPIPAAEPSLTISGTITEIVDNIPAVGVTVDFQLGGASAGQAVTDENGHYIRSGLQSGSYTLMASKTGSTCGAFTPANFSNPVVITIHDAPDRDFSVVCPTPTPLPTNTFTPPPSQTPTITPTPVDSPTPTITPTPSNTPDCGAGQPLSAALSHFTASPATVRSDGFDTATLLVTVKDNCGQLVAGVPVTITTSRAPTDTITSATGVTDGFGQFVAAVSSSTSSTFDPPPANVYLPSLFTVQAGNITVVDQPTVAFVCVHGIEGAFGSGSDVQYVFGNDTPDNRVLHTLDLVWQAFPPRALTQITMYPPTNLIWSGNNQINPASIFAWPSTDAERTIDTSGSLRTLMFIFNVDWSSVPGAGSNEFRLTTTWRNPADGRVCNSDLVIARR